MTAPPLQYTGIWQSQDPHEREYMEEIFGPFIDRYVTDGRHELVLDNAILFDAFCYAQDPSYYARFRGRNAFLVQFLDENYEGAYDLYENFKGVIRCHWSDAFNPERVRAIPIGYSNGMDRNRTRLTPASRRLYVWSFIGQMNKASRPDVAYALHTLTPNFLFAVDRVPGFTFYNRIGSEARRFPRGEYAEFLYESTFSPCPMGNVNLETFRVYESLECGAIPIVEKRRSFDYFRQLLGDHPMPTVRSWREARGLMVDLLRRPDELDQLQSACYRWWRDYKQQYTGEIREFLALRSAAPADDPTPVMRPQYGKPGWQIRELLRHHDARALGRRVRTQVSRLVQGKGSRVAYRPGS